MSSYGLKHTIETYTREFKKSKSAIDNVFTNMLNVKSRVIVTAISDHHGQEVEIKSTHISTSECPIYFLSRRMTEQNIQSFRQYLGRESWEDMAEADSLDDKFKQFLSAITYCFEVSFPLVKTKVKTAQSFSKVVLTPEILDLKNRLEFLYSLTKDLDASHPSRKAYRKLRRDYKRAIRRSKSDRILRKISVSSNKSKTMWNVINENKSNKLKEKSAIVLEDKSGNTIAEPETIANIFSDVYSRVFYSPESPYSGGVDVCGSVCPPSSSSLVTKSLFLFNTSPDEIFHIIVSLKTKSSHGSDGFSTRLLKQIADLISYPLACLINISFQEGRFPELLKHAIVRPLYKKGNKGDCNNYRPISLISNFSKIFEKVFLNRLLSFLSKNSIISPNQFGFMKGKSTTDAINFLTSNLSRSLDSGDLALGLFFDLTRAFDMVDHVLLLQKVERFGVRGLSHSWISSYLSGRTQCVQIPFLDDNNFQKTASSKLSLIKRGVPQGSILGPILFLLFINDLPGCVSGDSSKVCLYADDTSLSVAAQSRTVLKSVALDETNKIVKWFHQNNLVVNKSKTQCLEFSISGVGNAEPFSLLIEGEELTACSTTKFLGLHLDNQLNFHSHIEFVCKKISSGIFVIRNLAKYSDERVTLAAYYGLIYPYLSYAVAVWGCESGRTGFVFKLQKRALRAALNKPCRISCRPLFKENKVLTFPSIYILSCVTFVFKNFDMFSTQNESSRYSLRSSNNIKIPKHRTSFFEKHLFFNGIKLFNALPESLKIEGSVTAFEKEVKKLLLLQCCYSVRDFLSVDPGHL